MTIATMVNSLTGNAFSPAEVTAAVSTALAMINAQADEPSDYVEEDSAQVDTAVSMLAEKILWRGRAAQKNRTDPSIVVPTIESLLSADIKEMTSKEDSAAAIYMTSEHPGDRSQHWRD